MLCLRDVVWLALTASGCLDRFDADGSPTGDAETTSTAVSTSAETTESGSAGTGETGETRCGCPEIGIEECDYYADEMLRFEDVTLDLAAHRVRRGGRELHLGPTEFRLLRFFLENPGRVFSREQLLDRVWGRDVYVEPRTVDVHIRRLRKAINGPKERDLIRTVRTTGYALDVG